MNEIQGKKILIVGMGREGKSVFSYLSKNYPDLEVTTRDIKEQGEKYLDDIENFDTVIKSPGIPPSEIFKKAKHVTSLTNIFFEACPGQIVGITGTKGKSTTSSLISHILGQNKSDVRLIGNVGKPALDYLENSNSETIFVIELSSYQLMDINYSPHMAVLLPIYEEHLNYHGSFDAYWKAKGNITAFQKSDDFFIYYNDNEICQKIASKSPAQKIPFDKYEAESNLLGEANKINLRAAYEVTRLFDISEQSIVSAIKSFQPLPHRLERIGTYKGIEFINDSLATIPEATMHAIEAVGDKAETLIAGGFDRGINFTKLGELLAGSLIKNLILFPDTGEKIERALFLADPKTKIKIFKTDEMKEAVRLAYEHTSPGKTCLLSPASTSFNLFRDYEERGNAFAENVRALSK